MSANPQDDVSKASGSSPEQPWAILTEETVFDAAPFVRVTRQRVRTDSGHEIANYHQVILPDFVLLCPFDEAGRIITIWQYKHGSRRYGLTFPAGVMEPNEAPADCATRELLEETGYRAGSLHFLGRSAVSGNQGCGFAHMFTVEGCRREADPRSGDLETMAVRLMAVEEIEASIRAGDVAVLPHLALWAMVRAHDRAEPRGN